MTGGSACPTLVAKSGAGASACQLFFLRLPVLLLAMAGALAGQSVDIYSEFSRVDPFGEIVPADRGVGPREILSPAVARNAWASFHVVITAPPATTYLLYVVTNPLNACRVALYKEHFEKTAAGWAPDRLTELTRLPDFGAIPDPADGVDGQTTRAYLLDLWIPPDADVARFRLEVQLKVGTWVVRPMEVRVIAPRVPDLRVATEAVLLPPVSSGADAVALGVLSDYQGRTYPSPDTVRAIIRRNAVQDMALASRMDAAVAGPEALRRRWEALKWSGGSSASPHPTGAERYLRLRDWLYGEAQRKPVESW
ncbi:MAG: hypothetical protein ABSE42_05895 [Bryobacteraceae bacterium]